MPSETTQEIRAVAGLASIFAVRLFGLFMVLPLLAPYANSLTGTTPALLGLALGIYGLTQALLQIPCGTLSDFIGRKPVIVGGLILFLLGSVIAAMSNSIYGVIVGRALQGAGAIGSTLIATLADVTRESTRTQAMALLGMTIGLSFMLAMMTGPILAIYLGVTGLFWLTAILALIGILLTHSVVPSSRNVHAAPTALPHLFSSVLRHPELLRLNLGVFCQHAILTAQFAVLPQLLNQELHLASQQHWQLYLPLLLISLLLAIPFMIAAERYHITKPTLLLGIVLTILAELGLALQHSNTPWLLACLLSYFIGFNLLEALLPSLVSKAAPATMKGTAMGIYSTSQFLGIFAGGLCGGWLYGNQHIASVFYAGAALATAWLLLASSMQQPQRRFTHHKEQTWLEA